MIYLESADTLSAEASVASTITCTIYGRPLLLSTFAKLDQRQLATGTQTLYTSAGTETNIDEIVLVNPTASSATVTLWHDGVANSNMILPPVGIGPGEFAIYNDQGWTFYTASGLVKVQTALLTTNKSRTTQQTTISNSVGKAQWGQEIPAGEAKAGDYYRLTTWGSLLNNTGAGVTYTFRGELGSTIALATPAISMGASANRRRWRAVIDMLVESTTVQELAAELIVAATGANDTWSLMGSSESAIGVGSAAENLNAGLQIYLSIQMGTASVNADFRREAQVLERMPS